MNPPRKFVISSIASRGASTTPKENLPPRNQAQGRTPSTTKTTAITNPINPINPTTTATHIRHLEWFCKGCNQTCVNLNPESRCLCGHRLKDHNFNTKGTPNKPAKCGSSRCQCKHFFYLYGQGSFLLRCRCKHKGVEHCPVSKKCTKPACRNTCQGFDSPFVCNCNCGWKMHVQREVVLRPKDPEMFAKAELGELDVDIGNVGGVKRGM